MLLDSAASRTPTRFRGLLSRALGLAFAVVTLSGSAALQFDVWIGYDGIVPQAGWFPVTCEIFNDGPGFNGRFTVAPEHAGSSHSREVLLELPTGTRKRFVIPVFAPAGHNTAWSAYLRDERGKTRGERINMRPRAEVSRKVPLLGALARSFGGVPALPESKPNVQELQTTVARLQVAEFPDHPIALEGLTALYLNSEKALELRPNQVFALLAWVRGGGHLVVNIEQPSDVNATPWLRNILPCQVIDLQKVRLNGEMQQWIQNYTNSLSGGFSGAGLPPRRTPGPGTKNPFEALSPDTSFDQAELTAITASSIKGDVQLTVNGVPMIVEAPHGRGRISALLFSTELEPFRSWKNRPWFWARLIGLSPALLTSSDYNVYANQSIDGVFGALIDSKQVRKLPVAWLLLILVVYLLVIGPVDQIWLKRINRPMLTWLTFPAYVAFFSALIYFIGYKLRAGENEWNELHIVDLVPHHETAQWRGRTYASIYSSANQRYEIGQVDPGTFSTFRGEFMGLWGAGQESAPARVEQRGNNFRAEVFVPVWTSLLYVSDWLETAPLPVIASLNRIPGGYLLAIDNQADRLLTLSHLVLHGRVYSLGDLPGRRTTTFKLSAGENDDSTVRGPLPPGDYKWSPEMYKRYGLPQPPPFAPKPTPPATPVGPSAATGTNQPGFKTSTSLKQFVQEHGWQFQAAVSQRQRALGGDQVARSLNPALSCMVTSFISHLDPDSSRRTTFIAPPGLDLSDMVERGNAVLLAWDPNHSFKKPIYHFTPRRLHKDTLLRLVIPNPIPMRSP